ncbi:MAG TPA: lytic transglycosylase domain-containing protein [Candidatus Acidoferrum sp.]|nr:lytic transglycosylase domain-containing protein [Candidatus Acidoferrum sp.]
MTPDPQWLAIAQQAAQRHQLDEDLVCAVIEQESGWDTYAIRYEPAFRARYVAPLGLPPTEEIARSISWGLMQVMGQVAREFGYTGGMAALCAPLNGIETGAKVLNHKVACAHGNVREALLAWNGGANPKYPDEVFARTANYQHSAT